jgi:hypothetical protein
MVSVFKWCLCSNVLCSNGVQQHTHTHSVATKQHTGNPQVHLGPFWPPAVINGKYTRLARTIHIRCKYGIFGREIAKCTVHLYGSGQLYRYSSACRRCNTHTHTQRRYPTRGPSLASSRNVSSNDRQSRSKLNLSSGATSNATRHSSSGEALR